MGNCQNAATSGEVNGAGAGAGANAGAGAGDVLVLQTVAVFI